MGLFTDIGKTLNQSVIQLQSRTTAPKMFYVGCSGHYTYWSHDPIRALKFNLLFDAEETLKFLQSHKGYKKSKIINTNTVLDKLIPPVFHKPINYKNGPRKVKKSLKK